MKSSSIIVSYEITLPQRIYLHLDRLFSVFRRSVRNFIDMFWNENTLGLLNQKGHTCSILKEIVQRPQNLPSRVFRNALEITGQILRSQIERKRLFDAFMQYPCLVLYNEREIAKRLNTSTWFALNVKRQILKLIRNGERRDYFSLAKPSFSGSVVITSADDSLEKGQFKRLRIEKNKLIFELKVPVGNAWDWIKVEKFVPDRLRKALKNAKEIKAPLIKKVDLKSGFSIYRLVIPLEIQTKVKDKVERVFALDLSPSEKRIGVGVVVDSEGYSKPVFFNAYKMFKKLERLYREISNLEKKIDHIADDLHSTFKREHKEKLYQRLRHLYQEQKLRWRKFKDLRKQVLESFTNLVILHAKAYNCDAIAIEDLKFKDLPDWKNKRLRRIFSIWFYSKFEDRLRHKAQREGIKVLSVNPFNTSQVCHECGSKSKANRLEFACESCGKHFDRDYNASVNIGLKALTLACKTKSKPYKGKDIPARFPSLQVLTRYKFKSLLTLLSLSKLVAYLRLVETSYLKLKSLLKYVSADKYG
mgnify:CR=1 FL=1